VLSLDRFSSGLWDNMKVYWKDIEEFNSPWAGMAVNVETKNLIKPKFYLQTGENGRIKLVNGDTVIF